MKWFSHGVNSLAKRIEPSIAILHPVVEHVAKWIVVRIVSGSRLRICEMKWVTAFGFDRDLDKLSAERGKSPK